MKRIVYGPGGFDPLKPNSNIIAEINVAPPPPAPLDAVGALATLMAVSGAVDVVDAANAVGLSPDDLVAEAQAWAVAGS